MSHRNTRSAPAHASQVDITQVSDIKFWSHKFGCSVEQLLAAVKAVGSDAAAVTNYFLLVATLKRPMAA